MKKTQALAAAMLTLVIMTAVPPSAAAATQRESAPQKLCRIFPIFCMNSLV